MNNSKIPQIPETPKFPDISRYMRWVNEMEEKERRMSPAKRKYKWLIVMCVLFLLFVSYFSHGQTYKSFLDIPAIDGEFVTPTRTFITPNGPKANNILLINFTYAEGSSSSFGNTGIIAGKVGTIREITLKFKMDKATPLLYDLYFNHKVIAYLNIYKDQITNGLEKEYLRYKLSNVMISSIQQGVDENQFPIVTMTITYDKILRAVIYLLPTGTLTVSRNCFSFSDLLTCAAGEDF